MKDPLMKNEKKTPRFRPRIWALIAIAYFALSIVQLIDANFPNAIGALWVGLFFVWFYIKKTKERAAPNESL